MSSKRVSVLTALVTAMLLFAAAAEARKNLVVNLLGAADAVERDLDVDGDGVIDVVGALCFDADLVDPSQDRVIGSASDCLSDIEVLEPECLDDGNFDGCTVRLTDTTIFNFRNGTIISQESVSIQPFVDEESLSTGFTHMTGSPPIGPNVTFVSPAYRRFADGSVRLSGIVDMSTLASEGRIDFDCLFVIKP